MDLVLTCDFTDSSPQAPGLINCTRPALEGSVLTGVLPLLCFDMPWSPGGVGRCLDIRSTPGTVCHSVWPAGVQLGIDRGLASDRDRDVDGHRADAQRVRPVSISIDGRLGRCAPDPDPFGQRVGGRAFGAVMTDASAGGSGAGGSRDGTDSGGSITSLATSIPECRGNREVCSSALLLPSGAQGRRRCRPVSREAWAASAPTHCTALRARRAPP